MQTCQICGERQYPEVRTSNSSKLQCEVLCPAFATCAGSKAISGKNLQHQRVVRKDVSFAQTAVPTDSDKEAQCRFLCPDIGPRL